RGRCRIRGGGERMKRLIWIGALAAVACGGSNGGNPDGGGGNPNSVSGTVNGQPLNVQDAIFVISSGDPNIPDGAVVLALTDRANACSLIASTTPPTGQVTILVMVLFNIGFGGIQPITTGPYTFITGVPSTLGAFWRAAFAYGTCSTFTRYDPSSASSFNVTQVGNASGTHLKGNFNTLSFGTAGSMSGTFDASYCAAINNPGNDCLSPAPLRRISLPTQ